MDFEVKSTMKIKIHQKSLIGNLYQNFQLILNKTQYSSVTELTQ